MATGAPAEAEAVEPRRYLGPARDAMAAVVASSLRLLAPAPAT